MKTKQFIKFKKPQLKISIIKEFKQRFSPRFFADKEIKKKDIIGMFEAARWAPSGYNHQPWYFYYARNGSDSYKKIFSTLSDRNQVWAKNPAMFTIACYIEKCDHCEGRINKYAKYDLGASVLAMIAEGQSRGIYSREMGLFDAAKIKELLKIEESHIPFVVIASGYIGDYTKIDKEVFEKENQKRERFENISKEI